MKLRLIFIIIFTLFVRISYAEINLIIDDLDIPKFNILLKGCNNKNNKESQGVIKKIKRNLNSTNLFQIETWPETEIYKITDKITDQEIILYDKYSEDGIDALLY